MGRIGPVQTRWSELTRRRRLGVCAAALVAAGLVGATVEATSGQRTPAPVVWRDHVVEPAPSTTAP